jgi:arylsulfatase A-like enzyme
MPMPEVTTLAKAFSDSGYQTYGVGKLHVYPQRNRIGFGDVILMEEGRYELGAVDDYQIWLGDHDKAGQEFLHAMGNNTYYTRPWHLDEKSHPTCWATRQMARTIKRMDPTRPGFFYVSYQFPHPPLVPLQVYWDLYKDLEIEPPAIGDWVDDEVIFKLMGEAAAHYSDREIAMARQAFYAQCTLIDHQIRILVGTLREMDILDDTVIAFFSDHGDSLFDHNLVGKRNFMEGSAHVPCIFGGKPLERLRGTVREDIVCHEDLMPTLLDLCGIEIPETVEGTSLFSGKKRSMLYGEVSEGQKATRMVRYGTYKLIYYPCGNVFLFFDLEEDPKELHDLHGDTRYASVEQEMIAYLTKNLYGDDLEWLEDGKLVGFPAPERFEPKPRYGLSNQRGDHWPAPPSDYGTDA